jgi:hypothetical protein
MQQAYQIRCDCLGEQHPATRFCAEWLAMYYPDFPDKESLSER